MSDEGLRADNFRLRQAIGQHRERVMSLGYKLDRRGNRVWGSEWDRDLWDALYDFVEGDENERELYDLLADLTDTAACRYDHHGHCQTHMSGPCEECPHAKARRVLGLFGSEYEGCSIYAAHGSCSCSTGVPGNVCPLGVTL